MNSTPIPKNSDLYWATEDTRRTHFQRVHYKFPVAVQTNSVLGYLITEVYSSHHHTTHTTHTTHTHQTHTTHTHTHIPDTHTPHTHHTHTHTHTITHSHQTHTTHPTHIPHTPHTHHIHTQTHTHTNTHETPNAINGFLTRDLSNQADAHLRLRSQSHWNRLIQYLLSSLITKMKEMYSQCNEKQSSEDRNTN